MTNQLGEKLKNLRTERNISQKEMAQMLFVSRSSVANWETGGRIPDLLMLSRIAKILDVEIEEGGAREMGRRSRGTPRIANRILKRVRDYAQVRYDGVITEEVAKTALDLMDVDKLGLDHNDRTLLLTLIEKFGGGPCGLDTLAASIGEDAGTIEDVYEPYLLKNGLINRTPRGRVVTDLAYTHLGL